MRISPARSLAVAAVGAMAVSGLAVAAPSPAHAAGTDLVFLSQFNPGHHASVRFDGYDTLITLAAAVPDDSDVYFEVNLNPDATETSGGWTTLSGGLSQTGDVVTMEWNGTNYRGVSLLGRTVALRVVALTSDGVGGTDYAYSRRNRIRLAEADAAANAVHLDQGNLGFFTQPYADSGQTGTFTTPVSGTTSATKGTVALSWRNADNTFHGSTDAAVTPTQFKDPGSPSFTPGGVFSGGLDLTGYAPEDGDVLAVGATRDTDDVQPMSLFRQTIGGITPSSPGFARAGLTAPVTLHVSDTNGSSVLGAEVRRGSDGELVGYTDEEGNVTARQPVGTDSYYVNATDADEYLDTDGDFTSGDVTIDEYTPAAGYNYLTSADGDVFDDDEYADGDLGIQYSDQYGNPMPAGTDVVYRVYGVADQPPATLTQTTTGDDGVAPIAFDPAATQDGDVLVEWRLGTESDSTVGDPLSNGQFTAGQSVLTLTPDPANPAPIGGEIDYQGSLTVADRPLAGRAVSLRYLRGVEVVPGRFADAALVTDAGRQLRQRVVTNDNGVFHATVADRDETTRASEVGGRLTAATVDNVATDDSTLAGNAAETTARTTRFGDGRRGTVQVALFGHNGTQADVLRVAAPASVGGETVKIFRLQGSRLVLERTAVLNNDGDLPRVSVPDRNGAETTTYVVRLVASKRVLGSTSNTRDVS